MSFTKPLLGPYGAKQFGPFVFKVDLKPDTLRTWVTHGVAGKQPHDLEWRELETLRIPLKEFELLPPFYLTLPPPTGDVRENFNEIIVLARGVIESGEIQWYLAIDEPKSFMKRKKGDTLDNFRWYAVSAPKNVDPARLRFISPFLFDEVTGSLYMALWSESAQMLEWQMVAQPSVSDSSGPYAISPPTYYVPEKGDLDEKERHVRNKLKSADHSPPCPHRLFVALLDRVTGHTWFLAHTSPGTGGDWLRMDPSKWQWAADIGVSNPGDALAGQTRPEDAVDFGKPLRKIDEASGVEPVFNIFSIATSAGVAFYVEDVRSHELWCANYRLNLKTKDDNGKDTDGLPAHFTEGYYYDELFRYWCLCK